MSTTSIDLPEPLKQRAATAAQRAGTSLEQFILDAIAEKTELDGVRSDMHLQADQRLAEYRLSGATISLDAMEAFLDQRANGVNAAPPVPKKHRS